METRLTKSLKMNTVESLKKLRYVAVFGALSFFVLQGCDPDPKPNDNDKDSTQVDTSMTSMVKVGGALFSIPSPMQTSMLIKKSGATYSNEFLNSPKNINNYSTNYKKALNLGVYGADVGYVTIYDQSQDALKYMSSIRRLSDELGISGAFTESTLKRFEANFGKKDSLLSMIAVAYRSSDAFLKTNERNDVGGLILAGGWIESLYFTTQIAQKNHDQEVLNRIGEQKYTLENLIKLLTPYANDEEIAALHQDLIDLAYDFDAIDMEYSYVRPTVKPDQKLSVINSTTKVIINKDQMKVIADRVAEIRNKIIG